MSTDSMVGLSVETCLLAHIHVFAYLFGNYEIIGTCKAVQHSRHT